MWIDSLNKQSCNLKFKIFLLEPHWKCYGAHLLFQLSFLFICAVVLLIAILIAVIPVLAHANDVRHWLYLALTLLVVACPCALVISTPIATTCAIAQAARTGLIIKGGKHLEALGQISVLAMDKTGTLTEGYFQVIEIQPLKDTVDTHKLLHW